jgi:uncharacterized sulfatase
MTRLLLSAAAALLAAGAALAQNPDRPNILWLSSEDHGPHMGCYGDTYATTPNVDKLAKKGMIYTHCWSNAPVCAPARTTLIAGMYATSTGGEHMRSLVPYPDGKQMFPQLLHAAGYYCTNNAKEDYNVAKPGQVWDVSSRQGHWKNRGKEQPFFAVFNTEKSHESKIRARPHKPIHDPAKVRVPAYHPDTPEVRQDWAQYYDCVTDADADAGARLKELEDAGLAEETIVFYFADHGSGMPRSKRWPYNSGLHVPLVVYIPEKYRHLAPKDYVPGGKSDRLVSFVDFAPTLLSLAGVKPPEWMQGHAFLGKFTADRQPFLYGFRGRMDERYDMVRTVTDGRYVYVRNYLPHLIYGQHVEYMFQTPTTRVWKKMHDEGKLNAAQDAFWHRKPAEELYDLTTDPDEVKNLAGSAEHRDVLKRLREAHQAHVLRIRDVGFISEGDRIARCGRRSPYDMARDGESYDLPAVLRAADLSTRQDVPAPELNPLFRGKSTDVRYWAVLGVLIRGADGYAAAAGEVRAALADVTPCVRVAAAEVLVRYGGPEEVKKALAVLAELSDARHNSVFTVMAALTALDAVGEKAAPVAAVVGKLPAKGEVPDPRYAPYVPRLMADFQERWKK